LDACFVQPSLARLGPYFYRLRPIPSVSPSWRRLSLHFLSLLSPSVIRSAIAPSVSALHFLPPLDTSRRLVITPVSFLGAWHTVSPTRYDLTRCSGRPTARQPAGVVPINACGRLLALQLAYASADHRQYDPTAEGAHSTAVRRARRLVDDRHDRWVAISLL
jgi:hypothetical protein